MKRIRILVIEDNEDDEDLFRRQLRATSFDRGVKFVKDPRVALDLLQGLTGPDFRQDLIAIFIDVHLPYMSGVDLLRIIRTVEGMKTFPIVIMSTTPRPETLAACRDLQAIGFLEKPITLPNFLKVIAALFHNPAFRTVSC